MLSDEHHVVYSENMLSKLHNHYCDLNVEWKRLLDKHHIIYYDNILYRLDNDYHSWNWFEKQS